MPLPSVCSRSCFRSSKSWPDMTIKGPFSIVVKTSVGSLFKEVIKAKIVGIEDLEEIVSNLIKELKS